MRYIPAYIPRIFMAPFIVSRYPQLKKNYTHLSKVLFYIEMVNQMRPLDADD